METDEQFHANIKPEASPADARGLTIPTAFLDKCPCSSSVTHLWGILVTHNFINVKDHCRDSAQYRVTIRVLQRSE